MTTVISQNNIRIYYRLHFPELQADFHNRQICQGMTELDHLKCTRDSEKYIAQVSLHYTIGCILKYIDLHYMITLYDCYDCTQILYRIDIGDFKSLAKASKS